MIQPRFDTREENPIEAESALATLYNIVLPAGNCFLFFLLIVCTFTFLCRWKTGWLIWIPGLSTL
jgi:hypothetical protein